MSFPVLTLHRPSVLNGQVNGRLPESILSSTPGQAQGSTVRLVLPAARAWRALCAAAKKDGHVLKTGSPDASYRTYEQQKKLFKERYTNHDNGTTPKHWQGKKWYLTQGAQAATPGHSNHGLGLAIDTGVENDNDPFVNAIGADHPALKWLVTNEHRFGFSHEVQSEPWHIRYVAGDQIPETVLAFEKSPEGDLDMPLTDADAEKVATHTWVRDSDPTNAIKEPAWIALHNARRDAAAALAQVSVLRKEFNKFAGQAPAHEKEILRGLLAELSPEDIADAVVSALDAQAANDAADSIINRVNGKPTNSDNNPDEPDGD
jgi:hypothetical protein